MNFKTILCLSKTRLFNLSYLVSTLIIFSPLFSTAQVTINVKVWIGHDENGIGPSVAEVEELFTKPFGVIERYESHNIDISYCISEDNIIEDDDLITRPQDFFETEYRCAYDDPLRVDLLVVDEDSSGNEGQGEPGRAVASSLNSTLISHELGHSFGLYHLRAGESDCLENIVNGNSQDSNSGCFGNPIYSDLSSDEIADTPIQPEHIPSTAMHCNQVRNRNFGSTSPEDSDWDSKFKDGGSGNFTIDENNVFGTGYSAHINITNGGNEINSVSFVQGNHQIIDEKTFELRLI